MSAFWWAILAAGIWGVVPLLEKLGLAKTDPLAGLFYRCIGVIAGMIVLGLFILHPVHIKSVDLRSALLLIISGFLASFAAQIAFYHALKAGHVSIVVPLSGSYPLIAFLLGVLVLGEHINFAKMAGMSLIIAGIWLLK